jgi:hypothetical protein
MCILKNYRVYTTDLKNIETDEIQILSELIDFCIENGLNIYNKERLDYNWNPVPDLEQSNQIITVLHKLIEETYEWSTIKKVFNYYVENGISLFENGNNPLYSMATMHDVPAIDYMLTYCETHSKAFDLNDSEFIMKVISFNTVAVLKYLISRGAKPQDAIYIWEVPCPDCYNGEQHKCNFRNITLEYILLVRYGITLAELYNPDILDKLKDTYNFVNYKILEEITMIYGFITVDYKDPSNIKFEFINSSESIQDINKSVLDSKKIFLFKNKYIKYKNKYLSLKKMKL